MDQPRAPVMSTWPARSVPAKRVLLVDNDAATARVLYDTLTHDGFEVVHVTSGAEAIRQAADVYPDLVLMELALPDSSGFEVCRALRRRGAAAVIIVSARVHKDDLVSALNHGADDYVTKPFDIDELLARVHAVLRRVRAGSERIVLGDVTVDFLSQHAITPTVTVALTRRECDLLRYLAERRDCVVYRDELLREVWGYSDVPITRSVDSAVARLRKKIEPDPRHPLFIHTVHGDGYCLTFYPTSTPH